MDRKKKFYNRFKKRAAYYINDRERMTQLLASAKMKMESGQSQLSEAVDTIKLFARLLRAYISGEYRDIPKEKVLLIIGAFIYLVSPIDAIFDFMPGGLIDDAAIFFWLLDSMKAELAAFREWESLSDEELV
jgi:uncharacterized membrane protein YkvA (DUF1232 family)